LKTWKSPLSSTVSNGPSSDPNCRASCTRKRAANCPFARLRLGQRDGGGGGVDTGGIQPDARGHQRVLAGAAAGIENAPRNSPASASA
jgi:hypothetical protein